MKSTALSLIYEFNSLLPFEWKPSKKIIEELNLLVSRLHVDEIIPLEKREEELIRVINQKFEFNKQTFQTVINFCAEKKITFNYPEKQKIENFIDSNNIDDFSFFMLNKIGECPLLKEVINLFKPIDKSATFNLLNAEINYAQGKKEDIFESLFCAFVFSSFEKKIIHNYFSGKELESDYQEDYFYFLKENYPHFCDRRCTLIYLTIDKMVYDTFSSKLDFKNSVFQLIKQSYKKLDNHSFFVVQIKPIESDNINIQWELYSDIVLFSEKFIENKLKKGYFHPNKISEQTAKYIDEINLDKAQFEISNEGFTYLDCFVLNKKNVNSHSNCPYDILILFEKNQRDERIVPCPACRSERVQGNSYPKINVRSWECKNTFCPDKSKYNRGKRYSLYSIIRQKAIEEPQNLIPVNNVRKWRLDVVEIESDIEIIEMLLRHYSLCGDSVTFINSQKTIQKDFCERNIIFENYPNNLHYEDLYTSFYSSPFFHRFMVKRKVKPKDFKDLTEDSAFKVFCGNSFDVLSTVEKESVDGAVTSPPYYNAREYSHWDNIYTYLYDMYNIALKVFDSLKNGSTYLFNIFDYFDNENNLVFSAMGKKRMILGAYIIYIFRRIGFTLHGNIVWNKGEVEGKRNYNQGNMSPFYQAPLNSWEHIFIFTKGKTKTDTFPSILFAKPVFKIIKKKNILGHTAPFPKIIPKLLLENLCEGQTILDPFAGSFTTGRLAFAYRLNSINIDYNEEYCLLGLNLFNQDVVQHDMTIIN